MLPGPAVPGCCLISFHFRRGKLSTRTVHCIKRHFLKIFWPKSTHKLYNQQLLMFVNCYSSWMIRTKAEVWAQPHRFPKRREPRPPRSSVYSHIQTIGGIETATQKTWWLACRESCMEKSRVWWKLFRSDEMGAISIKSCYKCIADLMLF